MPRKEIFATIIIGIVTILCVVAYLFFDQQEAFVGSIIGAGLGYMGAKVERGAVVVQNRRRQNGHRLPAGPIDGNQPDLFV